MATGSGYDSTKLQTKRDWLPCTQGYHRSRFDGTCLHTTVSVESWTSNLENRIVLIAHDGNKIVGHLQISLGTSPRFREMGELIIYLHQEFQNLGLGTGMIRKGILFARERGLHRVELGVIADNHRAIHLYEKEGFQREGLKRGNYRGEIGSTTTKS
jgi:RimJ/RimL family protein N-acetyltransferase